MNQLDSAPSGARAQFVPLTHGGVQVEWHSLSGDLEIEIRRPFRFEYFFEDARSGQTEEAVGTNDFRRVEQLLQRL
ncbi:MAG: hypothetical protein WD341_14105 [Tistlia sp.]|uniref:hypothetical protein n=1 Tax=Tistlia sp. TaxID=3057121 RepID=UPI0034A33AD5